ncbi:MAG TPA: 6-phosphofructokinase [Thermotogota bacterium]|nr:6-phosphofructokinase [Thermotogota bacterium]
MGKNLIYAQSGGVTSVINASAYGAITAALNSEEINRVYAGKSGIQGILDEDLYIMNEEKKKEIERIAYTPGGIFGSCRVKIEDDAQLQRIFDVFEAHDIGYFLYNGGNDSMETAHAVSEYARQNGYELKVMGIPKTVDNDLMYTDHCPGFGSAAKFTATAILEATRDLRSMAASSTKVFILESMGRHAGWLAASASLAQENDLNAASVILLPEVAFSRERFLARVEDEIRLNGFCSIVASEALKDENDKFISTAGYTDNFGNVQLGKICNELEKMVREGLGVKVHTGLPDYLQRSSRHLASLTDWQDAIEVGARAVLRMTKNGETDRMITIVRDMDRPYLRHFDTVDLAKVAGETKELPEAYIDVDGFNVTDAFKRYAQPLISGEAPNHYLYGIPVYAHLEYRMEDKRL